MGIPVLTMGCARQPSVLFGLGGSGFGARCGSVLAALGGAVPVEVLWGLVLLPEVWWALHGVVATMVFPV